MRSEAQMRVLQHHLIESRGRFLVLLQEGCNASTLKIVQVDDILDGQKRLLILSLDCFLLRCCSAISAGLEVGINRWIITVDRKVTENLLVLVVTSHAVCRQL